MIGWTPSVWAVLALGSLVACAPSGEDARFEDGPLDCGPHGALVGAATDYAVGNLFSVDLGDRAVRDRIAPVSGDPLIVSVDCRVAQLNRGAFDAMRVYGPGAFERPRWERALPAGANAHAVVRWDDALVVALYGVDHLLVLDLDTGATRATIDLTPWADADGIGEADSFLVVDGRIWVALQRFRRDQAWTPEAGVLLGVDPGTWAVVDAIETGPSPSLFADVGAPDGGWLRTGAWFVADGALAPVTAAGVGASVLEEQGEAADVAEAAAGPNGALIAVLAPFDGGPWRLRCARGGAWHGAWTTDAFVADAAIAPDGEAWLALRTSWTPGARDPVGLLPIDLDACAPSQAVPVRTQLEPYSIGFY